MNVPCKPKCKANKKPCPWAKSSPVLCESPVTCPLGAPWSPPLARTSVRIAWYAVKLVKAVEAVCASNAHTGQPVRPPTFRVFRAGQDNDFFEATLNAAPGLRDIVCVFPYLPHTCSAAAPAHLETDECQVDRDGLRVGS